MVDIKEAKLFQGLPESEMRSVEKQLKVVKHPAGHEIVVRGEGGVGFMVITDGTVSVKTVQGHIRKLGPGDSFGEMALIDKSARSATVKADTEVHGYQLPVWSFRPLVESHPEMAWALLEALAERVREAEGRTPPAES